MPREARQRRKIEGGLSEVARLVPSDGYCVGGGFGLGDIAVGALLAFISLPVPEVDWSARYANLAGLRGRLSQRPSFRDTVPRAQQIDPDAVQPVPFRARFVRGEGTGPAFGAKCSGQ